MREDQPSPKIDRLRRRTISLWQKTSLAVAIGVAIVAAVLLPTLVAGWAPVIHWTCQDQTQVAREYDAWLPVALVNSPYGGNATGTGIIPADFPGGNGQKMGWFTNTPNGSAEGAFFESSVSYFRVGNVTELGPGANVRCNDPYRLEFEEAGQDGGTAASIALPSNLSDRGEADNATIFAGSRDAIQSPASFSNGFLAANEPNESTCGKPSLRIPVTANGFSVNFSFSLDGRSYSVPSSLPFTEEFTYEFPANFGSWQIDNLSAPGGPGGGWAFSYSPCP